MSRRADPARALRQGWCVPAYRTNFADVEATSDQAGLTSVFSHAGAIVVSRSCAFCNVLAPVIARNSGADMSAYFGKIQGENDPVVRKATLDRGNTVHVMSEAEADRFIRATEPVAIDWVGEVGKRGFDGEKLLAAAREAVASYRI